MGTGLELQVLLVEDDEALGYMVSKRLEAVGALLIEVHWRKSLTEAEAFLSAAKVDVVLLDLGLPDSDGLEGFFTLRNLQPDVPIVIISANDDRDIVIQALREGAQDYIVKGKLDPIAIIALVQKAIERHAKERAEYRKRKETLNEAVEALKSTKHQTKTEMQETIVEVLGAVLTIMSEEGEPSDEGPA